MCIVQTTRQTISVAMTSWPGSMTALAQTMPKLRNSVQVSLFKKKIGKIIVEGNDI